MSNKGFYCAAGLKAVSSLHLSGSLLSEQKVNNVNKTPENICNIASCRNVSLHDVTTDVFITTSGSLRRGALRE